MNDENSLARRLINAKNELRALKTAHNRGLGTIKLYSSAIDIQKPTTQSPLFGDVTVTINIDPDNEPFPFISTATKFTTSSVGIIILSKLKASNDGYTIYASGDVVLPAAASSTPMKVVSTSPISSITYVLTES